VDILRRIENSTAVSERIIAMKNIQKLLSITCAVLLACVFFSGCSILGNTTSSVATAQPTTITSEQSPDVSEQPSAQSTATATPEPTPSPTPALATNLTQLQPKDGYMTPKSLDGIDPINDKVIALTFDDGPHPENTPRLLDILKKNDVVATFFMVGTNAEEYPDIVKRVYDEGHEIGTHSWNHAKLTDLTLDEVMVDQYGRANDAIEAATGLRALIDRPPYGAMTEDLAEQIGREQILWSVDPEDWKYKDADTVYDHVVNGSSNGGYVKDGAIILSHDIHSTTIDAYERIIPALKAEGYKFVTVTQMMQIAEIRGKEMEYRFGHAPTAEEAAQSSSKESAASSSSSKSVE
jgi:peptidoglycan/xylan/chitin deacetylase (PgdA/CDA1 family)